MSENARILGDPPLIWPFDDLATELPFAGRSLRALRREETLRSNIDPRRFTYAAHALATTPVLEAFGRVSSPGPKRLALIDSPALRALTPLSSIEARDGLLLYDVFLDAPDGAALAELRRVALTTRVELPMSVRRRELPRLGPPPHLMELPSDGVFAGHIEHWVHVLWISPLLVPRMIATRTGRLRRPKKALEPNRIARSARIHPTAFVEGSYVGENVRVGAFASIRNSYVGRDSFISDFTKISSSVLGESTHTLADASFTFVVSLGQSTLASLGLKDTLLGRSVFLTSGVIFWSESIGGTISVDRNGVEVDTGRKVLGGCAGHLSVLGARTILAPGRALPNRTVVVMRKEEGVFKIPTLSPGTPACWNDGALVPFAQLRPGQVPEELA
ncbi:MAG: hypothetical protein HY791_27650 [Deltaproteobacteria bacterium]|nr:hypothetical protein [Deltaproteobacteria bacterium]